MVADPESPAPGTYVVAVTITTPPSELVDVYVVVVKWLVGFFDVEEDVLVGSNSGKTSVCDSLSLSKQTKKNDVVIDKSTKPPFRAPTTTIPWQCPTPTLFQWKVIRWRQANAELFVLFFFQK